MMLLTQAIKKKLPKLYSQEDNTDPLVICKFFTPSSSFTWFITEGEEKDGTWLFFSKVYSHLCPDGELGYTTLEQLEEIKGPMGLGVERDRWFTPKPLSQCKNGT